jgi:hypothetical protein
MDELNYSTFFVYTRRFSDIKFHMKKNEINPNIVDFKVMMSGFSSDYKTIPLISSPITDKYVVYIMAMNPVGSSNYNQIQICIFDVTQMYWISPPNYNTPYPQQAQSVDMALEKHTDVVDQLNQWKIAENYKAYDINQNSMDLVYNGIVLEYLTPTTTSPIVNNAYYFDPSIYWGTTNGQANIFLTRYAIGSSYPPHP